MGKSPCCDQNEKLKKGPWSPAEDQKLLAFIQNHGHGRWSALPAKAGLQRCGKSCRLRWINYLRPDIKRGKFSLREEQTIIQLHALLGNRWSAIANFLPKRTDNEIKNYWNTHVKKRLIKMGIDPVTHQPKHHHAFAPGSGPAKDAAHLNHMAQWESARLEAEARLVRESKKLVNISPYNQTDGLMNIAAVAAAPILPCIDVFKEWQAARSSKLIIRDNSYSIGSGMNIMMAMDESARESPTSNWNIPKTYSLQPMNAKSFPEFKEELDNTMVLQDVGAGNTINASWFAEAGLTGASGGFSDANSVILQPAASRSNMMEAGFESTQDMLVYTSNKQNIAALDIFVNNGGSGGDVENQNWIYWNNIISLVDTSPPAGSPVI